jgi:hypothetical protein
MATVTLETRFQFGDFEGGSSTSRTAGQASPPLAAFTNSGIAVGDGRGDALSPISRPQKTNRAPAAPTHRQGHTGPTTPRAPVAPVTPKHHVSRPPLIKELAPGPKPRALQPISVPAAPKAAPAPQAPVATIGAHDFAKGLAPRAAVPMAPATAPAPAIAAPAKTLAPLPQAPVAQAGHGRNAVMNRGFKPHGAYSSADAARFEADAQARRSAFAGRVNSGGPLATPVSRPLLGVGRNAVMNRASRALAGITPAASTPMVRAGGNAIGRAGGTRSWRNNNPGNIEFGPFARQMGALRSDGRFAIFPTEEHGTRAQERLLFEGRGYKGKTIGQAISRWAPRFENNVGAYVGAVTKGLDGVRGYTPMSALTPEQRRIFLRNMREHEGWRPGRTFTGSASTPSTMAGGSTPQGTPAPTTTAGR